MSQKSLELIEDGNRLLNEFSGFAVGSRKAVILGGQCFKASVWFWVHFRPHQWMYLKNQGSCLLYFYNFLLAHFWFLTFITPWVWMSECVSPTPGYRLYHSRDHSVAMVTNDAEIQWDNSVVIQHKATKCTVLEINLSKPSCFSTYRQV